MVKYRAAVALFCVIASMTVAAGGCSRTHVGLREKPTPAVFHTLVPPRPARTVFDVPPPPPPEPTGTPYHFPTQHLYISGSIAQPHIWVYELPFRNSADPPVARVDLAAQPHGMAVDNEGNLFVTLAATPSLLEFRTPIGPGDHPIATGGQTPTGEAVAVDLQDRLFVVDPMNNQLVVYSRSITPNTGPQFAMAAPADGVLGDIAAHISGELFVTQDTSVFPSRSRVLKYQVPFSQVRTPVGVLDGLEESTRLAFTRFPQRLFISDAGAGIEVHVFNYEQPAAFDFPHATGAVYYGRMAIDNDDNLYVLGSDGFTENVYVYYRPHGQGSQPTFVVALPATRAEGIAIGP